MDYVTIASAGNASDFGDLIAATYKTGATSSSTRGVIAGGNDNADENQIQYITIASTGNSADFGDLTAVRTNTPAGVCGGHGGIAA